MEYKVVPFVTYVNHKPGFSKHVALQLEQLINKYSNQGWTYLRMDTITNSIDGKTGFFGIGTKPAHIVVSNMMVFKKE